MTCASFKGKVKHRLFKRPETPCFLWQVVRVLDSKGHVVHRHHIKRVSAVKGRACGEVKRMLQDAITKGTGKAAGGLTPAKLCGKTGNALGEKQWGLSYVSAGRGYLITPV